jgi:LysR family nitrogen assimilation transcriptional regulator
MEIRHIRTFVHVAELRSLTRAAAFLRVSQPALSRQIRLLEGELRTTLFHRHGHGVTLTHSGELLFERSAALLTEFENIRQDIATPGRKARNLTGTVSIGVPISVSPLLAHPFLDNCRKLYPGITLKLVEGFSSLIHEWLLSGSIELAILYGPPTGNVITQVPLLEEDLFAIGAPSPENRNRPFIRARDLNKHQLILPHRPHPIREITLQSGIRPAAVIEVDAMGIMVELARAGVGYTILPGPAVMREIAAGTVVRIAIRDPGLSWTVSLGYANWRPLSAAAETIFRLMRSEISSLVHQGRWPARLVPSPDVPLQAAPRGSAGVRQRRKPSDGPATAGDRRR